MANYKPDPHMAERLRAARKHAGHDSAAEAARRIGANEQTYQCHENGSRGFVQRIRRYARSFKVDPHWLLTGQGEMTNAQAAVDDPLTSGLSEESLAELATYAEFLRSRDARR